MKKVLVLGAGGFIGSHLVKRLKDEGAFVRAADLKHNEFWETAADEFLIGDLREFKFVQNVMDIHFDEVYQLAADMGGAGYIFTGEHDADIMHNSACINLNVLRVAHNQGISTVFYSSSACIYPAYNQTDPSDPRCGEDTAYPAAPDSEYGWEKLFSERLYGAYRRNFGMNCKVARYHNIFGPFGTWQGGKEKAPAAICRKVAYASDGDEIDVWGDGLQTRSFLYIEDCIDATLALTRSKLTGPYNIGSEEMVSINQLVGAVAKVASKSIGIHNVEGPQGVRGRNSDNRKISAELMWEPRINLETGLKKTYEWIYSQVMKNEK